ncbi:MAG: ATP-binding cassette domain-containing protein [Opitutaceae bacterium]|nr:ATP-binding cassette domain-containing protein [Opitutaceae bacterium]
MLTLAGVSKSFGPRTLFADVSLFVKRTDRLGLVGANGTGKTTLFNLILGEDSLEAGTIEWERGASFGFLPQESAPAGAETILEIALGHSPHHAAGEALDEHDPDYTLEPRAKKILAGLGFRESDAERPAKTFSGGWVMRAHLARLLVQEPTLLLLDEPTNHLDLEALLWFQAYLRNYPGGLVIISHDRAFLNELCTGILELRNQTLYRWTGNFDDYLRQKEAHHAQQLSAYKNQQREIAHLQRFVDRFGAKASLASRAKSKEKQIERLREDAVALPEDDISAPRFHFPQPPRSGLKVATLAKVQQAYGDLVVYRDLDFQAERGQRLVLVGPNGAGKSTLLKILAGLVPIQGGERELGSNVRVGYFSQNRLENLNPRHTVLEEAMEMRAENPAITEQLARTILGGFLFRRDDVFKRVSVLSGGEKSRLALAKFLLAPPNLLLMDEPTTHLDIASTDALVNALRQYEGTLIFISHDVYFIRAIANQVLHVHAGRLTPYAGNYDYYLDKSRASSARAALTAGFTDARPQPGAAAPPVSSGSKTKEQRRAEAEARTARNRQRRALQAQVDALEKEITELEERQGELTARLEAPETYQEPGKPAAVNRELSGVVDRLHAATAEWESLVTALTALDQN